MRLRAIETFDYAGMSLKAGDEFDAGDFDAMLLMNSVHPRAVDADQPVRKKRKYTRRDMRAGD